MSTKSPKALHYLLCLQHRQSSTTHQHHLTQLQRLDRKFLIAGLIGEYQYLCHDDSDESDMTPAEHHAKLVTYSDDELLEDSNLLDSPYDNAEDYYDSYSAYVPAEYSL